ncbi:MAG: RluA family pseudouridine synthase [Niameybacter sp.]|uniref:RluA family pseudouridine synthase n=1 Tax=Niameybacter sp. TaxID=2033640 RepID=UPI002FC6644A
MKEVAINPYEAGQRLDKFLLKYMNKCPKGLLYKWMRTNKIKYNGKKPKGSELLAEGDLIKIFLHDEQIEEMQEMKAIGKSPIHFKTVYEDEHILIVDKPLGLLTQKDKADGHSLAEEVQYYLTSNGSYNPVHANGFIPAPCNRLDRNTAGIVLVGKHLKATQQISQMLKTKQISKYYMSIVLGRITEPMVLKGYHIKENNKNEVKIVEEYVEGAKPVETRILPLQSNGRYTLIEVQLVTGKTHQIRAHLSQIGHPIIGDPKYGDASENEYFRNSYGLAYQVLCAYKIKFELCESVFDYMENRVFTVAAPKIYSEICVGEGLIGS